jgi:hypothetical protein
MTNHIDTCTAILAQCMRITAQGKWHAFCDFSGHIPALYVRWERSGTDYEDDSRQSHAGMSAYLSWDDADLQLAAIRTELDKLEGRE